MNRAKYPPLVVLVLLQIGDLTSTARALHHGIAESNPLVRCNGLWNVKLYCIALVLLLAWYGKSARVWHLWALVGAYALIVAWNLMVGSL